MRAPFIVYADFEALVKASDIDHPVQGHKSFDYESQVPCSVGYNVLSCFPQYNGKYQSHLGEDCVDWFLDSMLQLAQDAMEFYFDEKRLVMTPMDDLDFDQAKICWICGKEFDPERKDKVRDHDHITGNFRGAAHSRCNIRLRRTCKIPIFFHNLKGYDGHFISRALGRFPGEDIRVIGQGMEKYLTLSIGKYLVFKDSLQFLGTSLQTLAQNLSKGGMDKFRHLKAQNPTISDDKLQLLVRKGVYPYEYMDSMERFEEDQLPP